MTQFNRICLAPDNTEQWLEMRKQDITSTEVAALFGCSPYGTAFELWHRKAGNVEPEVVGGDRVIWGQRLQDKIAEGVAEDEGWTIAPFTSYIRLADLRIGSSFDFRILDDPGNPGILEIKNVDALVFRDGWMVGDNGELEAPPHIELQVQHQMLVSGYRWAVIAALVGGNRVQLIRREADQEIHAAILERCEAFWASIDAGQEPEPDWRADAETVFRLHKHAEPGKVFDATGNGEVAQLCELYERLGKEIKAIQQDQDAAKAQLLDLIGDAEKVIAEGFTISAGVVGPAEVSYTRKAYRSFRVYRKKQKAAATAAK